MRLKVALACLLALSTAAPALAADEGPILDTIQVQGAYLLSREQVLHLLALEPGRPLNTRLLDSALPRLQKTYGTFRYSRFETEDGRTGLRVEVIENVAVTEILFRGNEQLSDAQLRDSIALEAGQRIREGEARRAERDIAAAYSRADFRDVSVRARMEEATQDRRVMAFRIREGVRAWVRRIEIEGNEKIGEEELLDAMESSPRGFISWFWPGWFDEEEFRDDLGRVERAYQKRGYLDAEAEGYVSRGREADQVLLRVVVREGARYTVEDLRFEGNTAFRDEELREAIPLRPGGPYDPSLLEKSERHIARLYAEQARWDVTPEKGNLRAEGVLPEEGTRVPVVFHIRETPPVYIRRIDVRGLTKTREMVVRRNLNIYPGELARSSKFEQSEQALTNTGYFTGGGPQGPEPVQIALAPQRGTLRDAIVRVQEGPTGRLMLSGGFGSEAGALGGITLQEDNFDILNWPESWDDFWLGNAFRGGGQRFAILLQTGTERAQYSIEFEEPAIRDGPYSAGGSLYSRARNRNEFEETRTGVSVSVGRRPTKFLRHELAVGYENIDIDDVGDEPDDITEDEGGHVKPFVRLRATEDRRDSRFMPTEGFYRSAELELSVGGVQVAKMRLRGEKYWVLAEDNGEDRHVLGLRGQMGLAIPYGGDVPVFERFFAGGFSTLRGFEYEGAAPSDSVTERLVGGEAMLLGSLEYSFPLGGNDRLRLVTFSDAGWVTESVGEVLTGWDDLRLSLGGGIRWQAPFLGTSTVEIDLAAPLVKQDDDQTQSLHFSLGAQRQF